MVETKYGIISDVHQHPGQIPPAFEKLKQQGIDKIILNGDIGDRQEKLEDSQRYIDYILEQAVKTGLETYVQPGSHETLLAYEPVIGCYTDEHPTIINAMKSGKIENPDHHLVFLPGSDFCCGGEYKLGYDPTLPTSNYIGITSNKIASLDDIALKIASLDDIKLKRVGVDRNLIMFQDLNEGISSLQGMYKIDPKLEYDFFRYTNLKDLEKLVTAPEKTIVVCHVPRLFDNPDTGVDMAHFYSVRTYKIDSDEFEEFGVIPGFVDRNKLSGKIFGLDYSDEFILKESHRILEQCNAPSYRVLVERKLNRGNNDKKNLYKRLGITRAVNGHFHESGHRAHNSNGNPIKEGEFVNDLFWNSGCFSPLGQFGILTVKNGQVSYQNLLL